MLFFNILFSFLAAIAFASGVMASVTPVRRGDGGDGGDGGQPTQSCSTGSLTCCTSSSDFEDLPSVLQDGLVSALDPNVFADAPIGLNCDATGLLGWYCTHLRLFNSMANTGALQL